MRGKPTLMLMDSKRILTLEPPSIIAPSNWTPTKRTLTLGAQTYAIFLIEQHTSTSSALVGEGLVGEGEVGKRRKC